VTDTSDDTNPGPNHVYISSDKCLVDKIDNIHISKQSSDTYGILLRELDGWILVTHFILDLFDLLT
jgi:hypothetical protein